MQSTLLFFFGVGGPPGGNRRFTENLRFQRVFGIIEEVNHRLQEKGGIIILVGFKSSTDVLSKAKVINKTLGREVKIFIFRGSQN